MDVSHHGGSAYYDSSTMDGVKPQNGVTKHSPNGLDSEVINSAVCPLVPVKLLLYRSHTPDCSFANGVEAFLLECSHCPPCAEIELS